MTLYAISAIFFYSLPSNFKEVMPSRGLKIEAPTFFIRKVLWWGLQIPNVALNRCGLTGHTVRCLESWMISCVFLAPSSARHRASTSSPLCGRRSSPLNPDVPLITECTLLCNIFSALRHWCLCIVLEHNKWMVHLFTFQTLIYCTFMARTYL